MELLSLKNIKKTYDKTPVLDNVSLSIKEGEFFTFLGPSGCGKTTLLRIVAGFVHPEEGDVFFEESNITNIAAEKRNVGMVFQNYALFPFMTVFENVAYGLKIQKKSKKEIKEKVAKYLDLVNLDGYEKRQVSELSGGEQQRVALARSLAIEPKLLLLDEPLSNLDARLRDKMRMELKDIQRRLGITTIFVTHDQMEALSMSDRIGVFEKGKCVQIGTPDEIYSNPVNSFVANFIGDTNLFSVQVDGDQFVTEDGLTFSINDDDNGLKASDINRKNKSGVDYISIRPQDIGISKLDKQGEKSKNRPVGNNMDDIKDLNVFTGLVKKVSVNGQLLEYMVEVGKTSFRVIKLNDYISGKNMSEGQKVQVSIHPAAIQWLKD